MNPDSSAFASVCWVVAIVVFVGAVAVGPRIAARSIKGGLLRAATHLLTIVTTMVAVLATLNAQYGWYVDWTDLGNSLFGGGDKVAMQTGSGGAPTLARNNAKDKAADKQAAATYDHTREDFLASLHLKADPGPGGQYATIKVPGVGQGATSADAGDVLLWFPQSYTLPENKDRTYPVIEAFHGVPGGPRDFHTLWYKADTYFAKAMSDKQLADSVLVVPQLAPNNYDTECVDGGGINMETWTSATVPQFIIQHLRVKPEASAWAALGFSAGAYCSAMAAVLHPDRYGAGIILGGYFAPWFSNWKPFAPGKTPERYDLLKQLVQNPPATQIWIEISEKDPLSGPYSKTFVKDARPPTSVTAVTLPHAGHRMQVWGAVLPDALAWLGKDVAAFAPTG